MTEAGDSVRPSRGRGLYLSLCHRRLLEADMMRPWLKVYKLASAQARHGRLGRIRVKPPGISSQEEKFSWIPCKEEAETVFLPEQPCPPLSPHTRARTVKTGVRQLSRRSSEVRQLSGRIRLLHLAPNTPTMAFQQQGYQYKTH